MANEKLLTTAETAEVLHVHTNTVRSWTKAGILTRIKIGRKVLYRANEVKELLTSNTSSDE